MAWTLTHPERPFTTNAERSWHYHQRAKVIAAWRGAFKALAEEAGIPPQESVGIVATPYLIPRGRTQDVAGCHPAVKAAIDGIVDAGILPDDAPKYLRWVRFNAPVRSDENALELQIFPI